jgi:sulfatase modifying factor 1
MTAAAVRGATWIPAATFRMGSDAHHGEEGPVRSVAVDGFWIDTHAVTNPAQFPGADLTPGSMVFRPSRGPVDLSRMANWWAWTPGASWKHPEGPGTSVEDRLEHPVVHIAYADARAYAQWAGGLLPTEAEWELAARGGLEGAAYTWGDEPEPAGARLANYWHGDFPWRAEPGYGATTPVGSYPANGYGLFDMAGNVWEWTRTWFDPRFDPAQPRVRIPRRVVKGGSFLCADSYCARYRPAARRPQMIDTGMSHIGFRCVRRSP